MGSYKTVMQNTHCTMLAHERSKKAASSVELIMPLTLLFISSVERFYFADFSFFSDQAKVGVIKAHKCTCAYWMYEAVHVDMRHFSV